jgi:hypothetical protein
VIPRRDRSARAGNLGAITSADHPGDGFAVDPRRALHRLAVYAAPRSSSTFGRRAAAWLGRDIDGVLGIDDLPRPDLAPHDVDDLTDEARVYGFHATLKPPFRLADGVTFDEVDERVAKIAHDSAPVVIPSLVVDMLSGFAAFRPVEQSDEVDALAAASVTGIDGCRRPSDELELARRRRSGLSSRQERYLVEWGYPYVFEEFRYHMTLSRRLHENERDDVLAAARDWFGDLDGARFTIDELCLVEQSAPGEPFVVASRHPLGTGSEADSTAPSQ